MLDELPKELEGAFLLQTLAEVGDLEAKLDELVAAWKAGRTAAVERLVMADFDAYPELYQRLAVQR
ncbi:MAG: TraB/GumN family protein, partial [Thiohalorhabdaceae bacterium]